MKQANQEVGLLLAPLKDPKTTFLPSLGASGSFGPSLGTLDVVLALFGDLRGTFGVTLGVLWDRLGRLWGSFGFPLGRLGGLLGRLWALLNAYGSLLVVNNVKQSTFRTYAFYVRKTTHFVGLGGQVGAKMTPRRAKMIQNG